jgi:hypothetical protein
MTRKIFGDFIRSRSRRSHDHRIDDLTPERWVAPYHGRCLHELRDRHVHGTSPFSAITNWEADYPIFTSDYDRIDAAPRTDAMCHVWTAPAVQERTLSFRGSFGCSHVFGRRSARQGTPRLRPSAWSLRLRHCGRPKSHEDGKFLRGIGQVVNARVRPQPNRSRLGCRVAAVSNHCVTEHYLEFERQTLAFWVLRKPFQHSERTGVQWHPH